MDEIISSVPITVTKNNRVANVHSVRKKVMDGEDVLDLGFGRGRHILPEKNTRFVEIRSLTGTGAKIIQDITDGSRLRDRGIPIKDEVVGKKRRVDGGASWTKGDP